MSFDDPLDDGGAKTQTDPMEHRTLLREVKHCAHTESTWAFLPLISSSSCLVETQNSFIILFPSQVTLLITHSAKYHI